MSSSVAGNGEIHNSTWSTLVPVSTGSQTREEFNCVQHVLELLDRDRVRDCYLVMEQCGTETRETAFGYKRWEVEQ